ncbi:MAG: hypothetical protein GF384_03435, partial [Elusimicrobia bacterium]|nr:hypothetical protein [Elusimicrobiota bacterium]
MNFNRSLSIRIHPSILYCSIVIVCYCLYPAWYLPIADHMRLLVLNLYALLGFFFFWYFYSDELVSIPINIRWLIPSPMEGLILLGAVILHVRFWLIPVPTGDDFQSHIGPPAFLLAKAMTSSQIAGIRIILWGMLLFGLWWLAKKG